jgi:hypothetical protein
MKTLKSFEFTGSTFGARKYDWPKLLDGGTYHLIEGEDFTCKKSNMKLQLKDHAAKMGKAVRIQMVDDGVVVQAVAQSQRKA